MRLFAGIDLPLEIKQRLLEFQSELKELGVNGLWKSQDNFHITLEFLGELEPSAVQTLTECLFNAATNSKPFKLTLEGLGGFPSIKRAHTLWTGVGGTLEELHRLRDGVHNRLKESGFVLEERGFKPHISLASRPQFSGIDLSVLERKKLAECMVKEIVLFESKAVRGKRIYTGLYRTNLGV